MHSARMSMVADATGGKRKRESWQRYLILESEVVWMQMDSESGRVVCSVETLRQEIVSIE